MAAAWGIHNDQRSLQFVEDGFVAIGWDDEGDLTLMGADRDAIKARLQETRPNAKQGAIAIWAGILYRFAHEMRTGDLIVYPRKSDSTINIGVIDSDYYWDSQADSHNSRRKVRWIATGIPRTDFSQPALYEVGSALTLFRVRQHVAEFQRSTSSDRPAPVDAVADVVEATDLAEDVINADRIEQASRDFIIETLMRDLEGVEFEHFVSDVLVAMGYRTRVTEASGDGGVDIIAHRDPLGLEPPIIKVQCKRKTSTVGGPEVSNLVGSLAPGGAELGLFVTLGSYSRDAVILSRNRQDLRLINGDELVRLIFDNYDRLPIERRRLLPMRSVWVVDKAPDDF